MPKQQLSAALFATVVSLEIGVCVLLLHLAAPLPVGVALLGKRFFSLIAFSFIYLNAHVDRAFCFPLYMVIGFVVGLVTKMLLYTMHWVANSIALPHYLEVYFRRYAEEDKGECGQCGGTCLGGALLGGGAGCVFSSSLALFMSLMGALIGAAVLFRVYPDRLENFTEDARGSETKSEGFLGF